MTRLGPEQHRVRIPTGAREFPVLQNKIQAGSVVRFSLRVKRPGREADHSPPSISEVKNGVKLLLLRICLHVVDRENLRLILCSSKLYQLPCVIRQTLLVRVV